MDVQARSNGDGIPPLPDDEDRDAFGHHLAGFVDGEGCFSLRIAGLRGQLSARFEIQLRADDRPYLEEIRSFLGVGRFIYINRKARGTRGNEKPILRYYVSSIQDLYNVIIPIFERYPLRAKKKRDFEIWRQGVELVYRVTCRNYYMMSSKNGRPVKWTQAERKEFMRLRAELANVRKYREDPSEFPAKCNPDHPKGRKNGFFPGAEHWLPE